MIFSRRIVFYRDSGPRTSPLSGSPAHDFLVAYSVFIRILSGVPAIKWNVSLESRIHIDALDKGKGLWPHIYIYIHKYIHICLSIYIYTYACTYIYMPTHIYIYLFFTLELTLCVSMIR